MENPVSPQDVPQSAIERMKLKLREKYKSAAPQGIPGPTTPQEKTPTLDEPLKRQPVTFGPGPKEPQGVTGTEGLKEETTTPRRRPDIAERWDEDAINLAKELFHGIVGLGKIGYETVTDPSGYWKDVKRLFGKKAGHAGQVWDFIKESATETHRNEQGRVDFIESATKRPFHFAADVAAVVTLVGGLTKTSAKMAGGVSRLGLTSEMAAKLPALTNADKVVKLAEAMEKVGNAIDPVLLAGRTVKAVAKKSGAIAKISDWVGVGEHTKPILAMEANEYASELQAAARDKAELAYKHLPPGEGDKLRRAIMRGAPEDFAALSPEGQEWLSRFTRQVTGPKGQEKYLETLQVGLTEGRKQGALAKGAALEHFGPEYTPDQLKFAGDKVAAGEWKPVYATLFEPEKADSLIDAMTAEYQKSRRYGRLEGRSARGAYEKDPFKIAIRQIDAYRDTRAKLRTMDRTIAHLTAKGAAKAITSLKELPEGWAVIETPILKRYFEVKNRAGALLVNSLLNGKPAEQAMREAWATVLQDPKLISEISTAQHIAVPKHVARLIDLRYGARNGLGIVYERLLSYWKSAAVLWRPSTWIGTAVGNTFLDLLHGVGISDLARSRRLKDSLPPEIGSIVQLDHLTEPGTGLIQRVNNTLGEYYADLDSTITRSPVFFKEVERARQESYQALKQIGADFFAAVDTIDDPDKWAKIVAASPEKLSEAHQNILRIQEQIAAQIPEIAKGQRDYEILAKKIEKMELDTAEALNAALGQTPSYRTRQLSEKILKLEQEAEAIRAQVSPTMEALRTARTTTKRGPEAIEREIKDTLEKLKVPNSQADQIKLEARIKQLEGEKAELLKRGEGLHTEAVQAKRDIRKGRSGLTRQLARALAVEEQALGKFYREILQDILARGGVKRMPGITDNIPERFLGARGRGVTYDVYAQEFFDRGYIADPTIDDLLDFIEEAKAAVLTGREATKNALPRARVMARGKVEESIQALVENVKERAKLRQELATVAKQQRSAGKDAVQATIQAEAKPIASQEFRNAIKDLEAMSKRSVRLQETLQAFKQRIGQTRRKLTAEEQRVIGKAAEKRRELEEAINAGAALESRMKQMKADAFEKLVDAGKIKQTIPELEQLNKFADEAIEAGNRLAGGYARLHPVERRYFRMAVPFWAYMKTMTMLVARLPFLYTKRVFFWDKWAHMVADLARSEDMPEGMESYYPVAHSADGGTYFMKMNQLMPWSGVRTADVGGFVVPSMMDVASANPVIKLAYEFHGGVPRWSKRPISPGENQTRMDNGEVWEINPNGTAKKVIPTPSPWRALWYLFPPSQLAEALFMNAAQTDKGWLLNPDPIRIPGTNEPMFPKELLERLTSFIGPTVTKKNIPEELQKERARKMRIAQDLIKTIRSAPPEKRDAMIETLKTYLENVDVPRKKPFEPSRKAQ